MHPISTKHIFVFERNLQKKSVAKIAEAIGIPADYLFELPPLYDTEFVAVNIREICIVFGMDEDEVFEKIFSAFPDSSFRNAPRRHDFEAFEISARKDTEDYDKILRTLNKQPEFGVRKYGSKRTHFKNLKR